MGRFYVICPCYFDVTLTRTLITLSAKSLLLTDWGYPVLLYYSVYYTSQRYLFQFHYLSRHPLIGGLDFQASNTIW